MGIFDNNKIYTITASGLSGEGMGVGRIDSPGNKNHGMKVFVEDMLPGETAKVRITRKEKQFAFGEKIEEVEKSASRITPACEEFSLCGGCQLQHADYPSQLKMKESMVSSCLIRLGHFPQKQIEAVMEPILGASDPWHYRNHVQYPVEYSTTTRSVNIGLYEKKSHRIVEHAQCHLVHPAAEAVREVAQYYFSDLERMDEAMKLRQVVVRVGFMSKEMMIILVTRSPMQIDVDAFREKCVEALENQKIAMQLTGIWMEVRQESTKWKGPQSQWTNLWGAHYIKEILGNRIFRISPDAFFQINSKQAVVLYDKVKEYLRYGGALPRVLLDMYCGTGSIGIYCSDVCHHLIGIEMVEAAVIDARANASANFIDNTEFFCGKGDEFKFGAMLPDAVILDPPRKGCDEKLLKTLLQLKPRRMIYVSCNPATLTRDLRRLFDLQDNEPVEYQIVKVCPVDMFPQTTHVETVVLLSRVAMQ